MTTTTPPRTTIPASRTVTPPAPAGPRRSRRGTTIGMIIWAALAAAGITAALTDAEFTTNRTATTTDVTANVREGRVPVVVTDNANAREGRGSVAAVAVTDNANAREGRTPAPRHIRGRH